MTPEKLQQLKQSLLDEKTRLEKELNDLGTQNPLVPGEYQAKITPSDSSDSTDDKAQHVTDFVRDQAIENTLEGELRHINETLARIESDSYGVCTNCQSSIEPKRLEVMPTAALCIDCASKAHLV